MTTCEGVPTVTEKTARQAPAPQAAGQDAAQTGGAARAQSRPANRHRRQDGAQPDETAQRRAARQSWGRRAAQQAPGPRPAAAQMLRHTGRRIARLVGLVALLGLACTIFTDSYEATLETHRQQLYGSWHAAVWQAQPQLQPLLEDHAAVEQVCTMRLGDWAVDRDGAMLGRFGSVSENFLQQDGISLLFGTLPTQAGQLAAEASVLDRMGCSYDVGQTITLDRLYHDANGEEVTVSQTFTLCGVVQNYSALWKHEGQVLASFFTLPAEIQAKDAQAEQRPATGSKTSDEQMLHLFVTMRPRYAAYAERLAPLCEAMGDFTLNTYIYFMYALRDQPHEESQLLQAVILAGGVLSLVLILHNDILRRRQSLLCMRMLGASRGQLALFYLREKLPYLARGLAWGALAGCAVPCLGLLGLQRLAPQAVTLRLVWRHLLAVFLAYLLGMALALLAGWVWLLQLPLRGNASQAGQAPRHRQFPRFRRAATNRRRPGTGPAPTTGHTPQGVESTMAPDGARPAAPKPAASRPRDPLRALWRADGGTRRSGAALAALCFLLILFPTCQLLDKAGDLAFQQKNYPADYFFGGDPLYYTPHITMMGEPLRQIQNAYGVGEVDFFAVSDYAPLAFSQPYDAAYADLVRQERQTMASHVTDLDFAGVLVEVSDRLLQSYAALAEGAPGADIATRLQDGQVLLLLPTFYRLPDGSLGQKSMDVDETPYPTLDEGALAPGVTATLQLAQGTATLQVAGILRDFGQLPFGWRTHRPYSLICNQATWRRYMGDGGYSAVYASCDGRSIPLQTDLAMSRIQCPLFFTNQRLERQTILQQLLLQAMLTLSLTVFSLLVTALLRFGLQNTVQARQSGRWTTLRQLGMTAQELRRRLLAQALAESGGGLLCALAALFLLRCLDAVRQLTQYNNGPPVTLANVLAYTHAHSDWSLLLALGALLCAGYALGVWRLSAHTASATDTGAAPTGFAG